MYVANRFDRLSRLDAIEARLGIYEGRSPEAEVARASSIEMACYPRLGGWTQDEGKTEVDIALEGCEILDRLLDDHTPFDILRTRYSLAAFGIATLLHHLDLQNLLILEGRRTEDLILEAVDVRIHGQSPLLSRYWFFEHLCSQGRVRHNPIWRKMKPANSTPMVREVLRIIEIFRTIPVSQTKSPTRMRAVVDARFRSIYLLREVGMMSLNQIGFAIGGRDHTTVLNGLIQHRSKMARDIAVNSATRTLCNSADLLGMQRYIDTIMQDDAGKPKSNVIMLPGIGPREEPSAQVPFG